MGLYVLLVLLKVVDRLDNKNKWIKKYNDWCSQPLNYNFNRTFFLISIIYCVCIFYDFSLTYLNFKFNSDGFFMYEISLIIKRAYGGDPFFCMLVVIFFMMPLIIVYGLNVYFVRRYGKSINAIRPVLFAVCCISGLYIWGGLTNFFCLINLRM